MTVLCDGHAATCGEARGDLWMIDHAGSTILRCRCLNVSSSRMRLSVPAGYGIGIGGRYELRAHLVGERASLALQNVGGRWGTVVTAEAVGNEHAGRLTIGVVLDSPESCATRTSPIASNAIGRLRRS